MFAISASFALCMACGGSDSSDGGGSFTTSVPRDQKLGSLSPADTAKLCSDVETYSKSLSAQLKSLTCKSAGLVAVFTASATTDAEARSACQTGYDKCLAAPAESTETDTCTPPNASCTATVGELSACFDALPGYISSASNSFPSCATLKLSDLTETTDTGETPTPPAACTTYEAKCPDDDMLPGGM